MAETRKIGEKGVGIVLQALRQRRPPQNMLTLNRQNDRRAGYDIELVARQTITDEDWSSRFLEVKSDRHDNGNFFIEIFSQSESNRLGGFINTPAHYLMYLFLKTRRLHIFHVPDLQRWIRQNWRRFPYNPVRTPTGDTCFTTTGIVVPTYELEHLDMNIESFYDHVLDSF